MDRAGLPALLDAIRDLHGVEATWIDSVPLKESHEGRTVWEGEVQVFEVTHPKASRVYAWSDESGPDEKRRFHAVLGAPSVSGPVENVRLAIVGEFKKAPN